MQRSLHDIGQPFSASDTHKPFNVWIQRSLHDTGGQFSASTHINHLMCGCKSISVTLDSLSGPQTHINHLMCGCKSVSMTLNGLSVPQTHINHLKCGCKGVSWALKRFSASHIPKTWWDFIGDENMMKTVAGLLFSHTKQVISTGHHQTWTHKNIHLFQTQLLKELFGTLVSAMRKHFLYKISIWNHPTNFYLPGRSSLLSITAPLCLSFFVNFSITGILGPCLQSHLPLNSCCGITTLSVR